MHTNPTLGGLLNATLGNATEIIISIMLIVKAKQSMDRDGNDGGYLKVCGDIYMCAGFSRC